jgi:hypothetical protein
MAVRVEEVLVMQRLKYLLSHLLLFSPSLQ